MNQPPLPPPEEVYIKNGTVNVDHASVQFGLYSSFIERWLEYFKREQLFIVHGDRLLTNPVSELKRVETFLGVAPYFNEDIVYFNATKKHYCWLKDGRPQCLGPNKGRTPPQISQRHRSILTSYYKPFNERLYKMINQSFQW